MKNALRMALVAVVLFVSAPAMSAEWYLSSFVGIGDPAYPLCTTENPCTTAVDYYLGAGWNYESEAYVREIVANTDTHNWALLKINYLDYSSVNGQAGIYRLPDYPFDAKMNAMAQSTKNNLANALTTFGIPTTCSTNADGYREVIRCIGRQININFDESAWGD